MSFRTRRLLQAGEESAVHLILANHKINMSFRTRRLLQAGEESAVHLILARDFQHSSVILALTIQNKETALHHKLKLKKLSRILITSHARRIFHARLNAGFVLICFLTSIVAANPPSTWPNTQKTSPQKSSQIFRGSWTASAGATKIFRGTWSAEITTQSPNSARGSWTLTNDANEITLEGTWSAQNAAGAWQGTWTARTRTGQSLSGTWNADLPNLGHKSLQAMFERTLSNQVAGSWRSGRNQGHWWLTSLSSDLGNAAR